MFIIKKGRDISTFFFTTKNKTQIPGKRPKFKNPRSKFQKGEAQGKSSENDGRVSWNLELIKKCTVLRHS